MCQERSQRCTWLNAKYLQILLNQSIVDSWDVGMHNARVWSRQSLEGGRASNVPWRSCKIWTDRKMYIPDRENSMSQDTEELKTKIKKKNKDNIIAKIPWGLTMCLALLAPVIITKLFEMSTTMRPLYLKQLPTTAILPLALSFSLISVWFIFFTTLSLSKHNFFNDSCQKAGTCSTRPVLVPETIAGPESHTTCIYEEYHLLLRIRTLLQWDVTN